MIRVVLIQLLMFALPFAAYGAYIYLSKKQRESASIWHGAPYPWLLGIGLVLVAASLVAFATFTGSGPDGTYAPAVIEDGKITPGRIQ